MNASRRFLRSCINDLLAFYDCDCKVSIRKKFKVAGSYWASRNKIIIREQETVAQMLITLAHEIVHYQQFQDSRLVTIGDSVVFNGKLYDAEMDYDERPWEKEAHSLEETYFGEWFQQTSIGKYKKIASEFVEE